MKKLISVLCLSVVFVLAAAPLPAEAGTRTLRPSQFTAVSTPYPSMADAYGAARRAFDYLSAANALAATYECEVTLPVGTRITRLALNAETGSGAQVVVTLYCMTFGDRAGVAEVVLAPLQAHDWYYNTASIALPRVTAGYKYWVRVVATGEEAAVYGVQVSYR